MKLSASSVFNKPWDNRDKSFAINCLFATEAGDMHITVSTSEHFRNCPVENIGDPAPLSQGQKVSTRTMCCLKSVDAAKLF